MGHRLSIIISNFNYEAYLSEAIEASLNQDYHDIEVVVVDDGSSDGSRQIIERFDDRIICVLQANKGQASAMNAGFAASSGDVVIFLDADDALDSSTGSMVMDALRINQGVAKIQYRLRVVDATGRTSGLTVPRLWHTMPSGNLRAFASRYRTYVSPPTSGNAFAAPLLRRIMPIPEDIYRISADQYLHNAAVIVAPILSIDQIGGSYRVHQFNSFASTELNVSRLRDEILRAERGQSFLRELADEEGITDYPVNACDALDRTLIATRLISLKLDPSRHPIDSDRVISLTWSGIIATITVPGLNVRHRLVMCSWFVALAVAPASLANRLATQRSTISVQPQSSGLLHSVNTRVLRAISRSGGVTTISKRRNDSEST